MKQYNRQEFIRYVYEKLEREYSWEAVSKITKCVFNSMEEIVTNGDKIYADGFITLQPKLRKEKKYKTFWKMGYTPAHYVLYCHPLKRTRDKIKNLPIKEETKGESTCTEE